VGLKRIPRAEALKRLFIDRLRYRPIQIDDGDTREGSRVAGAPPACFSGLPGCPRCGEALDYLLTIEADLVGPEVARGRALSIFACADVDCRLDSAALSAEPPSVVAITHDPSPRGDGKAARQGRRLARGHLRPDRRSRVGDSPIEASKLGGLVFRIQSSIGQDEDEAARRGLSFLLQLNDEELGEYTTSLGFWGGEAYLFTRTHPVTGLPTLEGGRVSWGYT